ncbi:MmcQ/YjbR family DNA-binding protein [Streptomyces sp. NPDC005925]|uniref:MmcQ/YjbR family DNA-binding protein n=1 Tax=Streptomyces sp. NPDC005925 TaxID=3157172 RepID=UPI0033DA9AE9
MTVPRNARTKWRKVREFALGLPEAAGEFPRGESVAKVNEKVFVFLGVEDGSHPLAVTLKLKDETSRAHALSCPGAEPAGHGLGRSGWVRVPLEHPEAPSAEPLRDRVGESYRAIAPKKPAARLDEISPSGV